ncbi:MAG: hypothetical protein ACT4OK_10785 [Gemmobacter sp.]
MNSPADAMRRAARFLPNMQAMTLYVRATDPTFNRPTPDTFDYTETVRGSVRWRSLDEVSNLGGGDVGDGVVTLVAPSAPGAPDLIGLPDGSFLVVKGAAGRDGLGMVTKVAVMRWTGTPPTVRGAP